MEQEMARRIRFSAFALLVCLATWPALAHGQGSPLVSGTIRDRVTNAPLSGVRVVLGHVEFGILGHRFFPHGETISDATGSYALAQLKSTSPDGRYVVIAGGTEFVRVAYPDQICQFGNCFLSPSTPTITLPANGLDFRTRPAARIAGQVLRQDNGTPVQAAIAIYRAGAINLNQSSNSNAAGQFDFDQLVEGEYWITAKEATGLSLVQKLYPGTELDLTRTFESVVASGTATPSAVAAGTTFSPTIELALGACFQGERFSTINNAALGANIGVGRVAPFQAAFVDVAQSSAAIGPYSATGLIPGAVKVRFSRQSAYQPNFFADAPTEAAATPVMLVRGKCSTGVDAHLVPRQVVRGTVRDAISGVGVAGASVLMGSEQTFPFPGLYQEERTVTNADGEYVLQGIQPAGQRLFWSSGSRGFFDQAYFMQPFPSPLSSWTRMDVALDQTITGIDFALQRGAYVSGRVHDGIRPISTANVYFVTPGSSALLHPTIPGPDGRYFTPTPTPASYRLVLRPPASNSYYVFPGLTCNGTGSGTGIAFCDVPGALTLTLDETREYPDFDFDLSVIDTLLRNGFE